MTESIEKQIQKALKHMSSEKRKEVEKILEIAQDPSNPRNYDILKDHPEDLNFKLMSVYKKFQGYGNEKGLALLVSIGLNKADLIQKPGIEGVAKGIKEYWKQRPDLVNQHDDKDTRDKLMFTDGVILAHINKETPKLFEYVSKDNNYVFDALHHYYQETFKEKK